MIRDSMKRFKALGKIYRGLGLTYYCLVCNTNVSFCKKTGKPLEKCPHIDELRIKQYVENEEGRKVTKTYKEKDVEKILPIARVFKEEAKNEKKHELLQIESAQKKAGNTPSQTQQQTPANPENKLPLLITALSFYIGYLSGDETFPSYMKRKRSSDYVAEVQRCFLRFVDCLKSAGYDVASLRVNQVNRDMVGLYYDYLLKEIKYSARSLNKNIGFMNSLYLFLGKEGHAVHSPFANVIRKPVVTKAETISEEEFTSLLERITPENGIEQTPGKVKNYRGHYRSWLKNAFRLALETGRRRQELTAMTWSGVIYDSTRNPVCIRVEDIKVNNIRGVQKDEEKKFVFVPITENLMQLLNEIGYEKYKNTDHCIIAPELKTRREKVLCDTMSRSFAHFIKLISIKKDLSLKSLRKTYITNLAISMGSNTKMVTGHSGDDILQRHYINHFEIAKSLRGFQVFGNKEQTRISELSIIRENHKSQSFSLEK